MFEKLPVKKEYVMPATIVVMLFVCYQFAFKKTIIAWQINKQLNKQLAVATDPAVQPEYLVRKNENLSKILSLYHTDSSTFRSNTINEIASIAQSENVKLSEVPVSDPSFHTGTAVIQKLAFEGSFFAATRMMDKLEKTTGIGRIRSATYKVVMAGGAAANNKKFLLEIYFENSVN